MHEPALVMCTVLPVDVHSPLAEKLTGKPEVAVAFSEKSGSPTDLFAKAPNVIVWSALPTVSVKLASVVAKQLSVAAIVMVCVPAGAALLNINGPAPISPALVNAEEFAKLPQSVRSVVKKTRK